MTKNPNNTIRSFIAVEIPNPETLKEVQYYQKRLQAAIGPLKLVSPDLMHITLKFLGNITLDAAKKIYEIIQNEINQPFFSDNREYNGSFKGVGDFRKQVFFVNIGSEEILSLLQQWFEILEESLNQKLGISRESRAFRPHLTIARVKKNRGRRKNPQLSLKNPGQPSYGALKQEFHNHYFGEWNIKKIVLKKSILTPRGPIYSDITF